MISRSIFWSLEEVKTATRKCFNISSPSGEMYEVYQIFILRQQPPVKALKDFCCRKRPRKAARQGVGKGKAGIKGVEAIVMQCSEKTSPFQLYEYFLFFKK